MVEQGERPEEIIRLSDKCLKDITGEGATLGEAKKIIGRMAHILEESERYRPETPLSDIILRS